MSMTNSSTTSEPVAWKPTAAEVQAIVAEFRPVIDACVARSRLVLAGAGSGTGDPLDTLDAA